MPHTLWFTDIFGTWCRRPSTSLTKNSIWSNGLSLKYQRFNPSGYKDIGIKHGVSGKT